MTNTMNISLPWLPDSPWNVSGHDQKVVTLGRNNSVLFIAGSQALAKAAAALPELLKALKIACEDALRDGEVPGYLLNALQLAGATVTGDLPST